VDAANRPYGYDQYAGNAVENVRRMMFHRLARDARTSAMENRYQQFIDMSNLLTAGRAVLVGNASRHSTGATILDGDDPLGGDDDRHWTLVRIVFPVKK